MSGSRKLGEFVKYHFPKMREAKLRINRWKIERIHYTNTMS